VERVFTRFTADIIRDRSDTFGQALRAYFAGRRTCLFFGQIHRAPDCTVI